MIYIANWCTKMDGTRINSDVFVLQNLYSLEKYTDYQKKVSMAKENSLCKQCLG